jgi:hypothetical protein
MDRRHTGPDTDDLLPGWQPEWQLVTATGFAFVLPRALVRRVDRDVQAWVEPGVPGTSDGVHASSSHLVVTASQEAGVSGRAAFLRYVTVQVEETGRALAGFVLLGQEVAESAGGLPVLHVRARLVRSSAVQHQLYVFDDRAGRVGIVTVTALETEAGRTADLVERIIESLTRTRETSGEEAVAP